MHVICYQITTHRMLFKGSTLPDTVVKNVFDTAIIDSNRLLHACSRSLHVSVRHLPLHFLGLTITIQGVHFSMKIPCTLKNSQGIQFGLPETI